MTAAQSFALGNSPKVSGVALVPLELVLKFVGMEQSWEDLLAMMETQQAGTDAQATATQLSWATIVRVSISDTTLTTDIAVPSAEMELILV